MRQQVAIPNVYMAFTGDGTLKNPVGPEVQAPAVLDELARRLPALETARAALS